MLLFVFRPSNTGRSQAADESSLTPDTALKGIAGRDFGIFYAVQASEELADILQYMHAHTHRLAHIEAYRYSQTLKKDAGTEICALVTRRKRRRTLGLCPHTHMHTQNEEWVV